MIETLGAMLPFLLPLLGLSVFSVGLIFDKRRTTGGFKPLGVPALTELLDAISNGQPSGGELTPNHPLRRLLSYRYESAPMRQARAQSILQELDDRLSYFPALANISTLTGLFGTVCGMIAAFLALRTGGGADPASLAGGLGTALFATAFGLFTAIPSLSAHAIFQKRVQAISAQLEAVLAALMGAQAETNRD